MYFKASKHTSTADFFTPGKLSVILDSCAGSSGKGKIGSFVTKNSGGAYQFVCNTFAPQASHIVHDRDHVEICYKQLNSCAHRHDEFEKMYIGQGASISLKALLAEIALTGLPKEKLGISGLTPIVQDMDRLYEEGKVGFDGKELAVHHDGTIKNGSTCSGVGVTKARRVMRDKNILLAKDVPELKDYICDVPGEILKRLADGQAGLLEIAQGFQLSNGLPEFYPYCTYRNVTVTAGLDDMMLPVTVVGNVMLNMRTLPIRIASKKYIEDVTGKHLTWDEVKSGNHKYKEVESFSGPGYEDQKELTWEQVKKDSGAEIPESAILTSLTKLPRRVFSFSKRNLADAIMHNQAPGMVYLSLNFVNWIDGDMEGATDKITDKVRTFIEENISPVIEDQPNVVLRYLGTGKYTEDTVLVASPAFG